MAIIYGTSYSDDGSYEYINGQHYYLPKLEGTNQADSIYGYAGNDELIGKDGDDFLDGGAGSDTMAGGHGNDTYVVSPGTLLSADHDNVIENAGEGYDTIEFSALPSPYNLNYSYTLGNNIERLVLKGAAKNGYGNGVANELIGNELDNVLDGKGGIDTAKGGLGNDSYYVNHKDDVVVELAGEGTDTVISSASSYALSANLEKLTLSGANDINGTGNNQNNIIRGNDGDNTLRGLDGWDVLYGEHGNDHLNGGDGNDWLIGTDVYGPFNNEVDKLMGGNGADTFVLGEVNQDHTAWTVFYNDNDSYSLGLNDYALIQDFDVLEGDQIQLAHNAVNYVLKDVSFTLGSTSIQGTGIYTKGFNDYNPAIKDELVAVVQNVSANSLNLHSNAFTYV